MSAATYVPVIMGVISALERIFAPKKGDASGPSMSEAQAQWEREKARMDEDRKKTEKEMADLREQMKADGANREALERQLKGVTDHLEAIQREKEEKEAALAARNAAERRRLDAIGMDNVNDYNFGIVGMTGA
jgi:Skp family chaperone for outer membrane proteins